MPANETGGTDGLCRRPLDSNWISHAMLFKARETPLRCLNNLQFHWLPFFGLAATLPRTRNAAGSCHDSLANTPLGLNSQKWISWLPPDVSHPEAAPNGISHFPPPNLLDKQGFNMLLPASYGPCSLPHPSWIGRPDGALSPPRKHCCRVQSTFLLLLLLLLYSPSNFFPCLQLN